MNTIPAIYEDGVFRPTVPIELPENTGVQVLLPSLPHADSSGDGIRRSAGAWATFPEMDQIMDQIGRDRDLDLRPEVAC